MARKGKYGRGVRLLPPHPEGMSVAELTTIGATKDQETSNATFSRRMRHRSPLTQSYIDRRKEVIAAVNILERQMGGKEAFIQALLHLPRTQPVLALLTRLTSPEGRKQSLGDLCAAIDTNLTVGDLCKFYMAGRELMANLVKTAVATNPKAVEANIQDITRRAAPHEVECPKCRGAKVTGDTDPPKTCTRCNGTGLVLRLPDLARQQYALDLAGAGVKTGPMVNVDNRSMHVGLGVADPNALVKLLQATDKILYGSGARAAEDVIDADPDPA